MAFDRPTLRELITQMTTDAEREAGAKQLRQSNLRVLPKVFAYACHGLYGFITWILKQLFPDTAEKQFLERQASIQGIYRRAASKATGTLTVSYTEGATLPVGTIFMADDQTRYETTAEPEVGSYTVPVQCLETGTIGNREASQTYTLVSPVVGVDAEAVGSEMAGGAEAESDESLRKRLLFRLQNPPRGGAKEDYIAWAEEVPGVTRAWCFPKEQGIGTVVVRFATDGMTEDGIPTSGMVQIVSDYIAEVAPVTATPYVVAPVAKPVNFRIKDLIPDSESVRAQVEAELKSLFIKEAHPGEALKLTHIQQAISSAAGEDDYELLEPTADVSADSTQLLVVGEVTYE
nr:MAG TPA: Baseplate J like protein [Caudoviricetes sp.]